MTERHSIYLGDSKQNGQKMNELSFNIYKQRTFLQIKYQSKNVGELSEMVDTSKIQND